MPDTVLGLDIGSNSIGWALLDEGTEAVVASGVRIFPEGVDRDTKGGEKSKNQSRRDARAMRRQLARRKRRRRNLRKALTSVGLLPEDDEKHKALLAHTNPYDLRRRALDEKISAFELGRVFMHLAKRRGFLSNRKTDSSKERKGILAKISELQEAMSAEGARTLGEFLACRFCSQDHKRPDPSNKVRKRHTRRDMYEDEFDAIWNVQATFYPDLLTDELRYGSEGKKKYPSDPDTAGDSAAILKKFGIHGMIFFQRKMYWPKIVVGKCDLEPKERRCPRAHRDAQLFRILQEVNNLVFLDRDTGEEDRLPPEKRVLLVDYLQSGKERKFDQIRKKLGYSDAVQFNFERGDRSKLQGNVTDAALSAKRAVGKKWRDLDEETRNAIVDILIHETREDVALLRLTSEYGLAQSEAEGALAVNLPSGYMNFSLKAIRKLLPYLKQGMFLMAEDETNSALHAAGYLRPDQREIHQQESLPPAPQDLPNPLVRQALVELRKVINAIVREHGRPARIHVELAREAKKSFEQRKELRSTNMERRQIREAASASIEELGIKPTRSAVNRYVLWQEQNENCIYCGDKISITQLFKGDADIDHILPRWRSLDDSLANKVVCHRSCNADKGDRTPREWLEDSDPKRYDMILTLAKALPFGKQRKIMQGDIQLEDFIARQLTDTAYISRKAVEYLRILGTEVMCTRGQMTAELRHQWGLNTILDAEGKGDKNRADHRHHAIDATVVALTDRKRLHALANSRGDNMPLPWDNLRSDVAGAIRVMKVSHRPKKGLHGALHEDTFYGATQKKAVRGESAQRPWAADWLEDSETYVRRKPVEEITSKSRLEKVRDKTIRSILTEHLRNQGIDPDVKSSWPATALKGDNLPHMPSGVPVKKVRMLESSRTFRNVSARRAFQFVKPGSNHHITYRECRKGDAVVWNAEVVTMWDAAQRARNGLPLVDTADNDDGRFVMSLSIGEAFEIDGEDGERLLCIVRKMRQDNCYLFYRLHTDARPAGDLEDNLYFTPSKMCERNARKVTIDPLGRARNAGD